VAHEGSQLFVATSLGIPSGPSPSDDPTWRVRVVSDDLATMGPPQIVLTRSAAPSPAPAIGSIAAGLGHRGLLTWDDVDGCRFVALGDDGSSAGQALGLGHEPCFWLTATEGGFVAFVTPAYYDYPATLLTLDGNGNPLGQVANVVTDPSANSSGIPKPVRLADGTMLMLWKSGFSILGLRVSEAGAPLSVPSIMATSPNGFDQVAGASLGSGALLAAATHLPQPEEPGLIVVPVDENGVPGLSIPFALGQQLSSVAVSVGAAGPIISWSLIDGGSSLGPLLVQPVTPAGAPTAPLVQVEPGWTATDLHGAGTALGALIAFLGDQPGDDPSHPTQAYVARVPCAP